MGSHHDLPPPDSHFRHRELHELPGLSAHGIDSPAPQQLIARFRDKPLDFAPGTAWRYSNSGYVLLGYLIERVSGEPYARFLHDNIFAPLGMKDTGYDSSTVKIPEAEHAIGYAASQDVDKRPHPGSGSRFHHSACRWVSPAVEAPCPRALIRL